MAADSDIGRHWDSLPEPVRQAARTRCTDKQIDALQLAAAGYGSRRAGRILGISPAAFKARLDGVMLKIKDELGVADE